MEIPFPFVTDITSIWWHGRPRGCVVYVI